ncbi:LysR family transcriptional regulator, partial [Rhizobium leguminosarum]
PSSRHLPPLVKAFIELAVRRLHAPGIGGGDDFAIVSR